MFDHDWRASHQGAVYDSLNRSLAKDGGNVVPGTESVVARTLFHCRAAGDSDAVGRLERISVSVFGLQQALRSQSDEDYRARRRELARLAKEWLAAAPMFPQQVGG